ncbi:HemK2/MTQ2 family protein methyltransferase [Parasphingorhabdus pacifica]
MRWLFRPLGVYRPQADTRFLAETVHRHGIEAGCRVLDVGTGTGALALTAIRAGADDVLAMDLSSRALLAAWFNAAVRGVPLRVRRGDLRFDLGIERFDLILANPPYVPGPDTGTTRRHRTARNWDAGPEGRALIDPLCDVAPSSLSPGGALLLVQSSLSGVTATLERLRSGHLEASVVARRREPFGPVMHGRAALLEKRGLVEPGQRYEELVVIRADNPISR